VGRYRAILREAGKKGTEGTQRMEGPQETETKGQRLTEGEALKGRVRYFVDGMVIGTEGFVERVFGWSRERFGPKRKNGARKLRGIETELRSMRDLQT